MKYYMTKLNDFLNSFGSGRIHANDTADLYIEIEKLDELIKCVTGARQNKLPVYIIGSGSWPHLSDKRVKGLLIKNNCRKFSVYALSGKVNKNLSDTNPAKVSKTLVYAESGTPVNQLVRYTIEEGLSGLEYHLGLPGSIGGAVFTNTRYKPKDIYFCDSIEKLSVLNADNEIVDKPPDYFAAYDNYFRPAGDIILSVMFKLVPEDKGLLWARGNEALEYRSRLDS